MYFGEVKQALGFFKLIRIQNCLIAFSAVIVGGYLQTKTPEQIQLVLFALVAALICGAGNAFNDILDIESDRINHPARPLPTRILSIRQATIITILCASFGITISLFLAPALQGIMVLVVSLLVWYNLNIKKTPLYGNFLIAFLGAVTVFSGGVAAGGNITILPGSGFPALMAFLLHFAREIIKDVQDLQGDQVSDGRTYPILNGVMPALRLVMALVILIVVASLIPLYFGWYGQWYAILVVAGVDLPLVVALLRLRNNFTPRSVSDTSRALKFAMVMGLIAISVESLFGLG